MTTMSVAEYARDCAAQGLRGDYSVCRSDFTVAQGYNYSADEQAVWRTLCDRQTKLTHKLAHHSYLDGVATLGLLDRIPDFGAISEKLRRPRPSSTISPTGAFR
jgi:phenylalanine-4-hydroxylase